MATRFGPRTSRRRPRPRPVVLPVVGDVAAGSTSPYTVQPGLCVRIMTGAPMPPGADAVVPLEDTDGGHRAGRDPASRPRSAAVSGSPARMPQPAPQVLAAGTHLGATQLGLLAAVGRDRVRGPAAAAGRRAVDRQRAGRARSAAEPGPDPGRQQRVADRRRARGRRDRLPRGDRAGRARACWPTRSRTS